MRPESPSEYIQKHLDIVNADQIEEARRNLSRPFGETDLAQSGDLHLAQAPFMVDLSYEEVKEGEFFTSDGEVIPNDEMRELKSLSLAKAGVNSKLDLSSLLPEGFKVYFLKGSGGKGWSSYADLEKHYIVIDREFNTPEAILALLHELGHGHTWEQGDRQFAPEKERLYQGDVTDLAHLLMEERDAWSYALRKIKPFLDKNPEQSGFVITKQDVMAFIKGRALDSYQKFNESSARARSSMYMSKAEEEWMTGESEWMSNFDEDKLE